MTWSAQPQRVPTSRPPLRHPLDALEHRHAAMGGGDGGGGVKPRDSTLHKPTTASVARRWAKEHPTCGPAWNAGPGAGPGSSVSVGTPGSAARRACCDSCDDLPCTARRGTRQVSCGGRRERGEG